MALTLILNSFVIFLFYSKVKKNYYRLALIFHPDRVDNVDKSIANEKFRILHHAYSVLSDANKRQQYDDGIDILLTKATRSAEWEHFVKPTSDDELNNVRSVYQNSEEELNCIEREFRAGNGSMTHLLNNVPYMRVEDEPRIIGIVQKMIAKGQVPKHKIKKIRKN